MHEVSVIIPTADRLDLINRAIDSVLNQSHPAREIIVVDNGRKPAILRDDLRDQVVLVRTEPRIGPGRSRNAGVEQACAEYVAFLDDDDYWQVEYLEKSVELLARGDVVVGRLMRQSEEGGIRPYKLFPSEPKLQRKVFYSNPGFGGQNILLKKSLFLSVGGFDRNMPASVDRDLAAKIMAGGIDILVQPQSVAVLCDHGGERVRASQVTGNWMFIRKYWRDMSFYERYKVSKVFLRRYYQYKILGQGVN